MGLAFSVPHGVKIPPSLRNMYKELESDISGFKAPDHGCLEKWAKQGVLLLNATLTVRLVLYLNKYLIFILFVFLTVMYSTNIQEALEILKHNQYPISFIEPMIKSTINSILCFPNDDS